MVAKKSPDAATVGKRMAAAARSGKPRGKVPTTGERLLAARTAAGLSQAKLAKITGGHVQTISNIERGVLEPSKGVKILLATSLGINPPELFPELAGLFLGPAAAPVDPPARRQLVIFRSAESSGWWLPADGSIELARVYWPELPASAISPGRLSRGIRQAIEDGIEVVFPALPPLE